MEWSEIWPKQQPTPDGSFSPVASSHVTPLQRSPSLLFPSTPSATSSWHLPGGPGQRVRLRRPHRQVPVTASWVRLYTYIYITIYYSGFRVDGAILKFGGSFLWTPYTKTSLGLSHALGQMNPWIILGVCEKAHENLCNCGHLVLARGHELHQYSAGRALGESKAHQITLWFPSSESIDAQMSKVLVQKWGSKLDKTGKQLRADGLDYSTRSFMGFLRILDLCPSLAPFEDQRLCGGIAVRGAQEHIAVSRREREREACGGPRTRPS